jgi:glycosyltransferase involved in cell wall biosynthesis/GT2 family glycosyltransferase
MGIAARRQAAIERCENMFSDKRALSTRRPPAISGIAPPQRIVVIEDTFPVVSETFILDQICGLMNRGLAVENWSLHYLEQQVRHPKVIDNGLVEKTHYLSLPLRELRKTPARWVDQFAERNGIVDLNAISAFHVHFGPNFIEFEPLFKALDTFLVVSFYGYDASKYILENGERCYDYLFSRANLITTPTACMRNELIRIGCPHDKVLVHRCGVEIPAQVQKDENANETVTLLTVARFVEKKGIEYALRAAALCPDRAKFRYRIIGDGRLKTYLTTLADNLGIKDTVEFLGFLPIDAIRKEMEAADIVVLTSVTAADGDQEGLPVTLVYAQAMGLPVISSYHSGIPELVLHGHSGLLSPERDVQRIALHMDMLVNNPALRRSLGAGGRQRALAEFDIEKLNDRLASYLSPPEKILPRTHASPVECPICGSCCTSFLPFGEPQRENALCQGCHSLERHRLLWLFLKNKTNIFTSPHVKVLDIAPVPFLSERLQNIASINYLSIDLRSPYAMRHMDITSLSLPDNHFDCILCCHVLEHVPDDRKAMSELYRVMKPGAWGIFQVPLKPDLIKTIEDPSVVSPHERLILYGNQDHVRYYGLDYRERLEAAGFDVRVDPFARSMSDADVQRYAVMPEENIYLCVKPQPDKPVDFVHDHKHTSEGEPFLSILIPTYNRRKFISDAIRSALNQKYQNFEVIVVDDGSTDGTPDIVKAFSDTRLRYVAKEHSGAPATRNRCIAEAKGEFLVWLDSDDMLLPDTLTTYIEALARTPDADVLYGDLIVTDHEFRQTDQVCYEDWYERNNELLSRLFRSNCIPNPGTMVRKSLYDELGTFDEYFRRAHDYELWTRFALKANFKHVPTKVVLWRWHDSNMSTGSVQLDTSFEAKIIKAMTENFSLRQLLPFLEWSDPLIVKTEALAWICVAKRLLELRDTTGAIECARKSHMLYSVPETLEILEKIQSMAR